MGTLLAAAAPSFATTSQQPAPPASVRAFKRFSRSSLGADGGGEPLRKPGLATLLRFRCWRAVCSPASKRPALSSPFPRSLLRPHWKAMRALTVPKGRRRDCRRAASHANSKHGAALRAFWRRRQALAERLASYLSIVEWQAGWRRHLCRCCPPCHAELVGNNCAIYLLDTFCHRKLGRWWVGGRGKAAP